MLIRTYNVVLVITDGGMKSLGLKEINFRIATMIINSTNLRKTTHAQIFYTVCYKPYLFDYQFKEK
jgi:hypothetical protein